MAAARNPDSALPYPPLPACTTVRQDGHQAAWEAVVDPRADLAARAAATARRVLTDPRVPPAMREKARALLVGAMALEMTMNAIAPKGLNADTPD
jgi:hypothetical protein